jgi:hypothetical protein
MDTRPRRSKVVRVRRFFRICRHDPPTRRDLMSHDQRGVKLRPPISPARQRSWAGVSVFTSLDMARRRAIRMQLGDYIAELSVPETVRLFGVGSHVDLEGTTPEELIGYCVRVYEV